MTMKVNFERRSHVLARENDRTLWGKHNPSCLFCWLSQIAKNHTATHLLNYALRKVFGEKVDQKGSLVENERLRFDFAHNKPIELDDLKRVESIVNQEIEKKLKINTKEARDFAAVSKRKSKPSERSEPFVVACSACKQTLPCELLFRHDLIRILLCFSFSRSRSSLLWSLRTFSMYSHSCCRQSCAGFLPPLSSSQFASTAQNLFPVSSHELSG